MIVLLYLILGTVTMSHVHDVSLVDGLLYTFSLLVTIGMTLDSDISIISVLTTSIYIILGVAIMSMCAYCLSKVFLKFTFIHTSSLKHSFPKIKYIVLMHSFLWNTIVACLIIRSQICQTSFMSKNHPQTMSRRFQGFRYRLRYWYQIKVWTIQLPISGPRDVQHSILIPILIPRLCKRFKIKFVKMFQVIE